MANRDFMTDYQRGNAYVWGRVTGESQTGRKVLKDILSSGSQFEKFQNDQNFQKFYQAETTDKKIQIINDIVGNKTMSPFDEYSFEDYDKYFKKHMAVMPENQEIRQQVVQPYVDRKQEAYIQQMDELDSLKREMSKEYAPYFKELNWLKAISPNLEFKPFGNQEEVK